MSFHDIRFPVALSLDASSVARRRVDVVRLASGHEERNTPWGASLRRFDAGSGLRSAADLAVLLAFFEARGGPLFGFRWKDWLDHASAPPGQAVSPEDQLLGMGDEVRSAFALRKRYGDAAAGTWRRVTRPVRGTVQVAVGGVPQVEGVDFTVRHDTGVVVFGHPPDPGGEVTAGFEFDVPVRFEEEAIALDGAGFGAGAMPAVPVTELRE
ncbi:MAG: phage distal tail protein, Rcc01695 family [Paracoccaceae bacterium]